MPMTTRGGLHDWDEGKLSRFITKHLRTGAKLPPSLPMEHVEATSKLVVGDKLVLSPSAQKTITDLIPAVTPYSPSTPLRKTTTKTVNSSVTETDLLNGEITIPANAMGANGLVVIYMSGTYLCNGTTSTLRLRAKYGATTLWDSNVGDAQPNQTVTAGWGVYAILANAGATNSQILSGLFTVGGRTSALGNPVAGWGGLAIGNGAMSTGFGGTATEDSTAAKAFQFTVQHGSNSASVSMVLREAILVPSSIS